MWDSGFKDYVDDWWNLMDFIMNSLYLATISLKIVAYVKVLCIVQRILFDTYLPHTVMWMQEKYFFKYVASFFHSLPSEALVVVLLLSTGVARINQNMKVPCSCFN